MDYTNNPPMIGKAGELRVRAELLLRGISCAVFDQDTGIDIVLENGKKIQVKTSSKPFNDKKSYSWRYSFSIRTPQVRNAGNGLYEKKYTKDSYKGIIDYFIFYCVKHDLFYIIPQNEIGQKTSIVVPTPESQRTYKKHKENKSTSKYEKYKNNWEQLL